MSRGERKTWVFPLDAEETIGVPGPLGKTVAERRGGRSRAPPSPCANQTCVTAGANGPLRRIAKPVAQVPDDTLGFL
ncbi:MAG: hypothetical protein LBU16_04405 [Treponema sp.]|nr:hypothetical protein [Treponema sp.]